MKLNICAKTTGIGDHVSAVYAACAVASLGHEVNFWTPHHNWLARVDHPNLRIHEFIGPNYGPKQLVNLYDDYENELNAAFYGECESRPQWYINHMVRAYGLPLVTPETPSNILGPLMPYHGTPYVLLAPFSADKTRTWEEDKWQYLAELLADKGYLLKAVCSLKEAPKLHAMLGHRKDLEIIAGQSPKAVLDLIQNSSGIVGNDSSIPHLAALHRKRAIAVVAHIRPKFVFGPGMKYITAVSPDQEIWDCTFCTWRHEGGLRDACFERCDALQSIEPEQVITFFKGL
jgi:hypothetical protein